MTAAIATAPRTPVGRRPAPLWFGVDDVPDGLGPCVVTIGVFDGVHRGHRRLIEHARAVARERRLPTVVVTFDPHPARVLGIDRDTGTLSTIGYRAELAAEAGADAVCVLSFTRELASRTPAEFARTVLVDGLRASAVVVGANFTFGARATGDLHTLVELGDVLGFTAHGVGLLRSAGTPCSSTHARERIRAGDLDAAARALGRPHRVDGHRSGAFVLLAPDTTLPPAGHYHALVDGHDDHVLVTGTGRLRIDSRPEQCAGRPVTVAFLGPARTH